MMEPEDLTPLKELKRISEIAEGYGMRMIWF